MENETKQPERVRRRELAKRARALITKILPVEESDEASLTLEYNGFYLQISFSEAHPIIVLYMVRVLSHPSTVKDIRRINEINLKSVLGCHVVNLEEACYAYRAVYWLDSELTRARFLEVLERCAEEAGRAYSHLARGGVLK